MFEVSRANILGIVKPGDHTQSPETKIMIIEPMIDMPLTASFLQPANAQSRTASPAPQIEEAFQKTADRFQAAALEFTNAVQTALK